MLGVVHVGGATRVHQLGARVRNGWVGWVPAQGAGMYLLQGTRGMALLAHWPAWVSLAGCLAWPLPEHLAPFQPQESARVYPSFRPVRVDIHAWGGPA